MKVSTAALLGLFVAMPIDSALAAESGFYIGGGVGAATLQDDPPAFDDIDESDAAWKVFAGYRFGGYIPLIDLAGEVTYRDMGNPDGRDFEYDASGFDASVLGIVTLGPIDLFGRLGIGNYSVESRVNGARSDDDGSAAIYGLGAGFRIFMINVRAEWERIEAKGTDNIDMFTINAYWRF